MKQKTYTQECFDDMERAGLLVKNGEFRRARDGTMQPVYVSTPLGKRLGDEGRVEQYIEEFLKREEEGGLN
jgi:hypothetical protein